MSTVKIDKNHSLVYKIAFVAFKLRFKKCRHDCILFLVDGRCYKPVYHLAKIRTSEDVKGNVVTRDCLVRARVHNIIGGERPTSVQSIAELLKIFFPYLKHSVDWETICSQARLAGLTKKISVAQFLLNPWQG